MIGTAQLPLPCEPVRPPRPRVRRRLPPVGRSCGRVESANTNTKTKTKTSHEGKTKQKQNHPRLEARSSLPLVGPATGHTNRDSTQTTRPRSDTAPPTDSWMRKRNFRLGNRICAKPPLYPAGILLPPIGRISGVPVIACNSGGQENEMMLTNPRRPRGRSLPLGQVLLDSCRSNQSTYNCPADDASILIDIRSE